jgi:flagellar protein FliJ
MSLKGILEYRRHVENQAREDYAAINREIAAQFEAVRRLDHELSKALADVIGRNEEGILAAEALELHRFADSLMEDRDTIRKLIDNLKVQKEEKQMILMAAARDCRIVEKLEDRRDQERIRDDHHQEQMVIDEAGIRMWTNRRNEVVPHE